MLGAFHPLSISMKQLNEIRPETLWKKENCSDISMHKDVNSILICIINVVLIPLLLTFSFPTLFLCLPCWLWASKCRLGVMKTQKFALGSIKAANWDDQVLSDFCFNRHTFSRQFSYFGHVDQIRFGLIKTQKAFVSTFSFNIMCIW